MNEPGAGARSSGPGRIRQLNREAVLRFIRLNGPSARTTLIHALDLSAAAVSSLVSELLRDALLLEAEGSATHGRQGRPVSLLRLNPRAAYALGIVLRPHAGGVAVETAWADYAGGLAAGPTVQVRSSESAQPVIDGVCDAVAALEREAPDAERITALAVGIPGVVDDGGCIQIAPRLPVIAGTELIERLSARLPYALSFHNDINLAVIAELHQQPRLRDIGFAYLFIATGVGAGIGLRGRLWSGNGWAGEVGQLRITRARGRRESFEELLGIENELARQIGKLGLRGNGLGDLVAAADAGDRRALRVIRGYAESLCDLIQVLNAVLDLDEVIVDFPCRALLERLLPRVQTIMAASALKVAVAEPSIGHAAGVRGAALAALDESLGRLQRRDTA